MVKVKLAAVALALLALLAPAATGIEFLDKEDLESDDSLWNLYERWSAHY